MGRLSRARSVLFLLGYNDLGLLEVSPGQYRSAPPCNNQGYTDSRSCDAPLGTVPVSCEGTATPFAHVVNG